jgi:hypothetical protein
MPSPASASSPTQRRRRWIWAAVLILLVLTVGSLALAWLRPEQTRLHFWLVAQCVPVLYWLLIWGFDRWAPEDDDVL